MDNSTTPPTDGFKGAQHALAKAQEALEAGRMDLAEAWMHLAEASARVLR